MWTSRSVRKKQKDYYSGKKKYHSIKIQIILNQKTKEILCIAQGKGHIHDFRLFKESIGQAIHKKIRMLADSGYQGIQKIHAKSRTPKKSLKKCPLTKAEKRQNRALSVERIWIENINAKIKVFKIFSQKYRNRRKRHLVRTSLVCGIYNCEL
ncbi:transposase family protein [Bacillus cereus]